ncbi:MAG: OmdA domain containing protein [Streptomyces sp.]|nr:OmdA domain containing protein [Streptomyces sp.]NUT25414.1 OmdA domain containing protein [Streptomyces sp.]
MTPSDGTAPRAFETAAALDTWLTTHSTPEHPLQGGLWVKVAKKGSGTPSVTAAEVNDVALCHGWITGQRKGLDATYYLQRITPRRPGSLWSMVNVRRVAELTTEGRMLPSGLAEVDAAQADGRWAAAYESQRNAEVPDELTAALEENPRARAAFDRLGRTERYQVMLGLLRARTSRNRAAQVVAVIRELSERR